MASFSLRPGPQLLQGVGESILWVAVGLCSHTHTHTHPIVLPSLLGSDCKRFCRLCLKTLALVRPLRRQSKLGGAA